MEEIGKWVMLWAFHLMKMNLTERMVLESPFRIRNGKIKLDH